MLWSNFFARNKLNLLEKPKTYLLLLNLNFELIFYNPNSFLPLNYILCSLASVMDNELVLRLDFFLLQRKVVSLKSNKKGFLVWGQTSEQICRHGQKTEQVENQYQMKRILSEALVSDFYNHYKRKILLNWNKKQIKNTGKRCTLFVGFANIRLYQEHNLKFCHRRRHNYIICCNFP